MAGAGAVSTSGAGGIVLYTLLASRTRRDPEAARPVVGRRLNGIECTGDGEEGCEEGEDGLHVAGWARAVRTLGAEEDALV